MTEINVLSYTQQIDVVSLPQEIGIAPAIVSVSVTNAGPQGPPGVGGLAMNFNQVSPADEWLINHNFGYYPNINLYTTGGMEMLGQIVNVSVNQIRVYFTVPVAGSARLS